MINKLSKLVINSTYLKKSIVIIILIGLASIPIILNGIKSMEYDYIPHQESNFINSNPTKLNVLGHWDFGQTFDVTVNGNYLYLAAGEQVRIYDISSKEKLLDLSWKQTDKYLQESTMGTFKENVPPIKILHTDGLIEGLYNDGNYLYIVNDKHFMIAETLNPENSTILSTLDISGKDIAVKGNYAYITAPEDKNAGLKIVDISNKDKPKLIRTIILPGYNRPRRLEIYGKYLYLAMETDHRLYIVDISDPINPEVVGNYLNGADPRSSYSGVAVKGNYAFVIEYHYGIHVIDISNPEKPVEVSRIIGAFNEYNYNDIKIYGKYAFISERYQGFDIIDISNPLNISVVAHATALPGYEEGIFVASLPYGNYTFLSTNTMGLGFINIDNVFIPKYEGMIATPGGGDSIAVKDNYAYIGSHNEGVWVVDIMDKENPKEVALIVNKGRNSGIEIQGNYLYISGDWSPLSVANISDPLNPRLLVARFGTNIEGNLVADGGYLYNGNLYYDEGKATNKVIVFNISKPASPSIVFKKDLGLGTGSFISAKYGTNYLLGGGQNGLFIIDISKRSNPIVAGKYPGLNIYMGDIEVEGNIAYVGVGNDLYAFDISDVTKPHILGSIDVTMPNSIAILGTSAFTFPRSYRYGFESIDISDPKKMKIIDSLNIGGNDYTGDIVESNRLLFSASGYIIDPVNSSNPVILDPVIPDPVIPDPGSGIGNKTIYFDVIHQWAKNASSSSEYSSSSWSAAQVTGVPDTLNYSDASTAWATLKADDSIHWIELDYEKPIYAHGINVRETYNPGTLIKMELKDGSGVYHTVWSGNDPSNGISGKISWSNITFTQTKYLTRSVKLFFDTSLVPGWNEIDAVELIG